MEVSGGIARATLLPKCKAAVIHGGGFGHFPAFCGIIDVGFMGWLSF
jgi:dihydroxyacetone kinase